MKSRIFFIIFFFVCASFVQAYTFNFQESGTGKSLTNFFVEVQGDGISQIYFVDEKGMELDIPKGTYTLYFFVDDPQTQGKDYYNKQLVTIPPYSPIIPVFPIGSVSGTAVDQYNNLLPHSQLSFNCQTEYAASPPPFTDAFGAFSYAYAPLGKCKVFATFEGSTGSEEILVEPGRMLEITIHVDRTLQSLPSSFFVFLFF